MRRLFLIPWLIIGTVAQQKILEDLGISFHNFLNGVRQTNGGLIFGDLRPQPEGIHPQMPLMPVMQPIPSGLEILHPGKSSAGVNFFTIPPMQQHHEIKFVDLFHKTSSATSTTESPPPPPLDVQVEPPSPPAEHNAAPQSSPESLTKIIPKALTTLIKNVTAGKEIQGESREIPNRGGFSSNLDASRQSHDSADVDVFEVPIKIAKLDSEKSKEIVDETTSAITERPTTVSTTSMPSTTLSLTFEPESSTATDKDSDFEHFLQSTNLTEQEADVLLRIVEKALDEEVNKKIADDRNKLSGIKIHEEKENFQSSFDDDAFSSKGVDNDSSQKHFHQLKTAETHLNINLKEVDESSSERILLSSTTQEPSSSTTEEISHHNTVFNGADDGDYRSREQAEFDRLVNGHFGAIATTSAAAHSSKKGVLSSKNGKLLRTTTPKTTTTQSPVIPYRSVHHAGPPTEFEKLASDYRVRLTGHNGINDFIKALRNANIGFFARPTYNRYTNP